jgi:hypothetical protein
MMKTVHMFDCILSVQGSREFLRENGSASIADLRSQLKVGAWLDVKMDTPPPETKKKKKEKEKKKQCRLLSLSDKL